MVGAAACLVAACGGGASAALTRLLEARRLASELHVEFIKASEASSRAVMATSDDTSAAAIAESSRAREGRGSKRRGIEAAPGINGYRDDLRYLDGFTTRFEEYKRLDDEILSLAVEGTNVKAQRLSFGPAQQAADAFRKALEAAASHATSNKDRVDALAGKARSAVLEIQVMHAPHIAEPEDDGDDAHGRTDGGGRQPTARKRPERTAGRVPPGAGLNWRRPSDALDRFIAINAEIVSLSRRNSNVRSLALSFGRKRVVTAECEDQLRALEQALAKHEFSATR